MESPSIVSFFHLFDSELVRGWFQRRSSFLCPGLPRLLFFDVQLLVQLPHPAHNSILKLNSSWPSSHLQPILPSIFLAVWPDPRQSAQTAQQSSSVESESMARLLVEEVMPLFGSSFLLPFLGFCRTHPVSYFMSVQLRHFCCTLL